MKAVALTMALTLMTGLGPVVWAEEDAEGVDYEEISLDDLLVVTATKQEQRLTDAPSTVSVISRSEIETSWAFDIVDLLRSVPGMDFAMKTYSDPDLNVRGFNDDESAKTLLLIDGHPINTPHIGNAMWPQAPLSLLHLEQVEVVRGPGSTLYGANAFSGVINLRTIPLQDRGNRAVLSFGENGYHRLEGQGVVHASRFHVAVTVGEVKPEDVGELDAPENKLLQGWKYKDAATRQQAIGEMLYEFLNGGEIYLSAGLADTEGGYNSDPSAASIRRTTWKHRIYRIRYEAPLGFGDLAVRGTWYQARRVNTQPEDLPDGSEVFHPVYWWNAKGWRGTVELSSPLGERNTLISGVEVGRFIDNASFYAFPPVHPGTEYTESFWSAYLDDSIRITDELTGYVGVRYDDFETFGGVASPRLALVWNVSDPLTLRLNAGRSYRKASTVFYFYKVEGFQGNPELDPEVADEYELGARIALGDSTDLDIVGFYKEAEDLVQTETHPSGEYLSFFNLGDVRGGGGEVEVRTRFADWGSGFVNYSYQSYQDEVQNEDYGRAPEHKVNLGFRATLPWETDLTAEVNYVSDQSDWVGPFGTTVEGGTFVNLAVHQRLLDDRLVIFLRGFNVLDEERYEIPDFTRLGRRVSFGISIRP